jgi:hypothetical protein
VTLKQCPLCGNNAKEYLTGYSCGCSNNDCTLADPMSVNEWQNRPIEEYLQTKLNECESNLKKMTQKSDEDDSKLDMAIITFEKLSAAVISIHFADGTILDYGETARDALNRLR